MKNIIRHSITAVICGLVFINPVTLNAQQNITPDLFIQQAATSGINEVAMGNLGLKRSEDAKVKAYAETILGDHTVINAELRAIAKRKNIKLPDSMSMPVNSMQTRTDTTVAVKKDGMAADSVEAGFDVQYVQMMIDDHQKAIELFKKGSNTTDPDVKTFSAKYLPVLQRHLDEAVKLAKEMPIKNNN